ncbi:Beta-fructosidase, partial [Liquorilactobacillus mali KCTC 3596 = DSM 20444]
DNLVDLKDITVSGSVDTTKAGSYRITYSYTDSHGNTISKTISVTVSAEDSQKPTDNSGSIGNENNTSFDDNNTNMINHDNVKDSSNEFDNLSFTNKKPESTEVVNNKASTIQNSRTKKTRLSTVNSKFQNKLPQTGEKDESIVTVWGLLLTLLGSIGTMVGIKKSRKKDD